MDVLTTLISMKAFTSRVTSKVQSLSDVANSRFLGMPTNYLFAYQHSLIHSTLHWLSTKLTRNSLIFTLFANSPPFQSQPCSTL